MADQADDLEYSETNVGSAQAQGVRKNISLKLRGKGRGKGRKVGNRTRRSSVKKAIDVIDEDTKKTIEPPPVHIPSEKPFVDSDLDEVISKLEVPAFSPMDRAFPEPLHQNKKLRWDHKVNLIGEKVIDPTIHCCGKCSLPILNYGRLIPCKHVFCFDCAKKSDKLCPKCDDKVQRVEQSALGTVFMCIFGGTKNQPGACGRTYLSHRDLQAHVNHRHLKPAAGPNPTTTPTGISTQIPNPVPNNHIVIPRDPRDPRGHLQVDVSHPPMIISHITHPPEHRDPDHSRNPPSNVIPAGSPVGQQRQFPHSPANYSNTIPVSNTRPNLITVPIQDDGASSHPLPQQSHIHPPSHGPQYTPNAAPSHPMPPMQHPPSNYPPPPPHGYQHQHPPPNAPPYSQAPPMTTQTFTQPPPPVHHQPPIHTPGGPIYSTPPPSVHHPPPPTNYTPPPRGPHPLPPPQHPPPQHPPPQHPPPQHFPPPPQVSGPYEENPGYMQQWGPGAVPPPQARTPLPPRPMPGPASTNKTLLQTPRNPDPSYRPPYYQ